MAFDIVLQVNNSSDNTVDKDLTTLLTLSGVLREQCSIMNPVIVVETSLINLTRCNYVTIPDFGRSYFIQNITSISATMCEITAHVDVLTSFREELRLNSAIISRSENKWNLYLNDGSLRTYANNHVVTQSFPNGFNSHNYILLVSGD